MTGGDRRLDVEQLMARAAEENAEEIAKYGHYLPTLIDRIETVEAGLMLRIRAARHELSCRECRVTWRSWFQRLVGDERGIFLDAD